MKMIHEKIVHFRFKGKRTYVHGTDIYGNMLDIVHDFFGQYPTSVKGSFHLLLENNGIFRIYESDEPLGIEQFTAIFSIIVKGKAYQVVLFDAGTSISVSYEYDERKVLKNMVLKNEIITMHFKPIYTYMEQLVSMTKKLHLAIYPEAKGKWLFTKIQINDAVDNALYSDKALNVKAERNFQNKLTQCSIRLDDKLIGYIFFSQITKRS